MYVMKWIRDMAINKELVKMGRVEAFGNSPKRVTNALEAFGNSPKRVTNALEAFGNSPKRVTNALALEAFGTSPGTLTQLSTTRVISKEDQDLEDKIQGNLVYRDIVSMTEGPSFQQYASI